MRAARIDFRSGVRGGTSRGACVEARAILSRLDVAERYGEGVGSVSWFGRFGHAQEGAHHELHLFFSRVPVASYAGLYLTW